jgi:hypothetical protein
MSSSPVPNHELEGAPSTIEVADQIAPTSGAQDLSGCLVPRGRALRRCLAMPDC